jgi:LuxR family transcriptional regulator, quorum-sensing system regulator SolR
MKSTTPINFENEFIDGLLLDWQHNLRMYGVQAVVVLGPDVMGTPEQRVAIVAHPPRIEKAAYKLAASTDFGAGWHDSDSPLVAWQTLAHELVRVGSWQHLWSSLGYRVVVRVEFSLPVGRAFECFLFGVESPRNPNEAVAAQVWKTMQFWPLLSRALATARCPLSRRERECLCLAFEGMTARNSALSLGCSERTVNFHLAQAMAKLGVNSKLAAIQRACWLGAI